jgi:CRISPR system Cascade subunit CasC
VGVRFLELIYLTILSEQEPQGEYTMFIELHAIQTFAPSNLNRDDTGNPKDALFGGVRRARISSQSAKRAMRVSPEFKERLKDDPLGIRTKNIKSEIVKRLQSAGQSEEAAWQLANEFVDNAFAQPDKKAPEKTNVLIFISSEELDAVARELGKSGADATKLAKEFEKSMRGRTSAPDIALFGRMLAEKPALNIDAACQVAHAISTHEVTTAEFDYYTAVDDLLPEEETGAGMLGLVPFNSATYYRCVRVDWDQLVKNLGKDDELAARTLEALMRAFALVVPSGMQNRFVNRNKPDFLLAVVRHDHDGQSLVNAFERPVRSRDGYAQKSIEALATYWEQVDKAFRLEPPTVAVLNPLQIELPSEELAGSVKPTLSEWIGAVTKALPNERQ